MSPSSRWSNEALVGLFVAAALVIGFYLSIRIGHLGGLASTMRAVVVMDDAAGLKKDLAVKIAGVDVGRIAALRVEFDKAHVEIELDTDAQVRRNVVPIVRAKSLLGEKYLELQPIDRDAPLLTDGDRIVAPSTPVEPDQLFNRLGDFLDTLSEDEVRAFLAEMKAFWSANKAPLGRIVANVDALLEGAAGFQQEHGAEAGRLFNDLRDSLAALRGTAVLVDARRDQLDSIILHIESLAARLDEQLGPLLDKGARLADRADALGGKADPMVEELGQVLTRLNDLLERMGPLVERAEAIDGEVVRRVLREEGVKVHIGNIMGE